MYIVPALYEVVFLIVVQLPVHTLVVRKGDDCMDDFTSVSARLVGGQPFSEHLVTQVLILFGPRPRLLGGALVFGAHFIGIGEEAEGARFGRSVAGEAKNDRGLEGAIESGE